MSERRDRSHLVYLSGINNHLADLFMNTWILIEER